MSPITYRDAGVDVDKGDRFAENIQSLMQRTFDGRVVGGTGGFAGLFSVDFHDRLWRRNYRHPVLVSSTDGVGTKLKVAFRAGRHDTVGIDLVAMSVNDIVVMGAEPLFFLDYLATGKLSPDALQKVVKGISDGCRMCDCALLAGETAEMPGFYTEGEYDMAGFVVGVVEQRKLVNGKKVRPGDGIIGLPSDGIHSNGYSLVRKLIFDVAGLQTDDSLKSYGLDRSVADELLRPTRIYARPIREVMCYYRVKQPVHAMAHITGGGLPGNIGRVLPGNCDALLDSNQWERPAIFDILQTIGDVPQDEMYGTFNMGIGFVLVVSSYFEQSIMDTLRRHGEDPILIGRIKEGSGEVEIS
ncbi:MAG: phosphoribosylformylglycinamidine cyclo-ligase [Planctomycetota bacterium]